MQPTPKIKKSLSKTSLAQDSPGAAENLRQHLDGDFAPHALDNRKALPGGQEGQAINQTALFLWRMLVAILE